MVNKFVIDCIMEEELREAKEYHPEFFASNHEAYAVIKEEFEEAYDEILRVSDWMECLWNAVKSDEEVDDILKEIKNYSYFLIAEVVQVYAMAEKGLRSNAKVSVKEG